MSSFYSRFTFVIFYTLVCRKIALVANVICLWKPTLNKVSCILYSPGPVNGGNNGGNTCSPYIYSSTDPVIYDL